jgi:hypothetical protein
MNGGIAVHMTVETLSLEQLAMAQGSFVYFHNDILPLCFAGDRWVGNRHVKGAHVGVEFGPT